MPGYLKRSDIKVVLTDSDLKAMVSELQDSPIIAFDLENDGEDKAARLDPFRAIPGSFQFATDSANFYLPFISRGGNITGGGILNALRPIFRDPDRTVLGHNIKFDIKHLMMAGVKEFTEKEPFRCKLIDTMVADWITNENDRRHGLEWCADKHLGVKMITFDEAEAAGNLSDERIIYGCDDVRVPWRLWHEVYDPQIKEEGLNKVYHELEMEFIYSIIEMELHGMKVNTDMLMTLKSAYEGDLVGLEHEIHDLAGQKFLLSSPAQMSRVLFDTMGFDPKPDMERNKTGNWPTGKEHLEKYAGEHPIFDKILRWRKISKLKTGFVSPLLEYAMVLDGRVRATFNHTGTVTGRLSSKEPNLQNIPREKNAIRDAFVAEVLKRIICADYSQLELRLMAHFSGDPTLMMAYNTAGADVHQITADECGCSRQHAKTINFGLIYGMAPGLLARMLKIPYSEAETYHEKYFAKYVGVKGFHRRIWNTLDAQGYVTTITKRRRRFPEWQHLGSGKSEWYRKLQLHRQAVNVVIQGSGGDLIKIAQRNFQRRVASEGLTDVVYQCSQVHDEMIVEAPEEMADNVLKMVLEEMEGAVALKVPLVSEGAHRASWGEAKAAA